MAPEIPLSSLRSETATLLRRVEAGERLTITSHGRPVAELVPTSSPRAFVPRAELLERLVGTLSPKDDLAGELRASGDAAIELSE